MLSVAVGTASGGITAAFQGANILQGALIGGFSSAVSFRIGRSSWVKSLAGKGSLGQGFVSVMSGGVVGGLSSVATGSDFWQGFTQGGISAGLSFAANAVAQSIENNDTTGQSEQNGQGEASAEDETLGPMGPPAGVSLPGLPGLPPSDVPIVQDATELIPQAAENGRVTILVGAPADETRYHKNVIHRVAKKYYNAAQEKGYTNIDVMSYTDAHKLYKISLKIKDSAALILVSHGDKGVFDTYVTNEAPANLTQYDLRCLSE